MSSKRSPNGFRNLEAPWTEKRKLLGRILPLKCFKVARKGNWTHSSTAFRANNDWNMPWQPWLILRFYILCTRPCAAGNFEIREFTLPWRNENMKGMVVTFHAICIAFEYPRVQTNRLAFTSYSSDIYSTGGDIFTGETLLSNKIY